MLRPFTPYLLLTCLMVGSAIPAHADPAAPQTSKIEFMKDGKPFIQETTTDANGATTVKYYPKESPAQATAAPAQADTGRSAAPPAPSTTAAAPAAAPAVTTTASHYDLTPDGKNPLTDAIIACKPNRMEVAIQPKPSADMRLISTIKGIVDGKCVYTQEAVGTTPQKTVKRILFTCPFTQEQRYQIKLGGKDAFTKLLHSACTVTQSTN